MKSNPKDTISPEDWKKAVFLAREILKKNGGKTSIAVMALAEMPLGGYSFSKGKREAIKIAEYVLKGCY